MKYRFLLAVLAVFILVSCKKDPPPTEENPVKIGLRTLAAQFVQNTSTELYFEILDDGGEDLLAVGVCWSTGEQPTIADSSNSPGKKTGSYHINAKNLKVDTRYYARAFATNRFGTVYGNRISFITVPLLPYAMYLTTSSITQTSATLHGRVVSDGGSKVTDRGFAWDSVIDFSIATNNRISVGSDTGTFSITINGLKPGFNYYVGAYATNKAGTYINKLSFRTLNPPPPSIVTEISVSGGNVVAGGTVTAAEGITITSRGIIRIPDFRPDLTSQTVPNGSGTGTYQAILGTATSGAKYRVQAYADFRYKSTEAGNVKGAVIEFMVP